MNSFQGLDLSTNDDAVVRAFDHFSHCILHVSPGAEQILIDAENQPDEPVLRLGSVLFWLFGQTPETEASAAEGLRQLHALPPSVFNRREHLWLGALTQWSQRNFDAAALEFEKLTAAFPQDLLAAKCCEFMYYILGQQHSGPRFLQHMLRLRPFHQHDADFLAMEAFAHELCGDLKLARSRAEESLSATPGTVWAQHAMEHVLLWEGNNDAALELLSSWTSDWEVCARPVHSHNAWHLALARLDRLETGEAWRVFDEHVWMKTPNVVVEQLDSIAFLWRAEMAGVPVDAERWIELSKKIENACSELFMPFATAHYAYALARAEAVDSLDRVLHLTDQRASQNDEEALRVWAPTGRHVIHAAAALGKNQSQTAASHFDEAIDRMTEIGGSDAQDDLFRFAYIDSLSRAGRRADAGAYLNSRLRHKTPSPLENALLTQL